MKKVVLTSLIAVFAASAANAAVFDPTYRVKANEWAGQFGIAYQTGANKAGTSQTDLTSGQTGALGVNVAYGILDSLYVSVAAGEGFSESPEIGINWQLLNDSAFGLDLVGKYGAAWTHTAGSKTRIGNNNVQAGLHIYGTAGQFQWALTGLGQYELGSDTNPIAFAQFGGGYIENIWNLLLKAEAQYAIDSKWAVKGELDYNIDALSGDTKIYDRSVALGVVYSISDTAAVYPYLAYHLKDVASYEGHDTTATNSYWQLGAQFGVQF